MVLRAICPRLSTHILPHRAPRRVRGDGYQHLRLGTSQRGTVPSQLPVSSLRLLRRRLHYWNRGWGKRTGHLYSLSWDVRKVGTGWSRPDGRSGGKGNWEKEQTEAENQRRGHVTLCVA